jgi:hypothetical protein
MDSNFVLIGGRRVRTSEPSNGGKYPRLRALIEKSFSEYSSNSIDVFDVMAWCIKRTMGENKFCPCDSLFVARADVVRKASEVPLKYFLDSIRIISGPEKGQIPKFKFCPTLFAHIETTKGLRDKPVVVRLIAATQVGIGLLSVNWLARSWTDDEWMTYLQQFLADPNMQIREIIALFQASMWTCDNDKVSAIARMCYLMGDDSCNEFANRCVDLAQLLRNGGDELHHR